MKSNVENIFPNDPFLLVETIEEVRALLKTHYSWRRQEGSTVALHPRSIGRSLAEINRHGAFVFGIEWMADGGAWVKGIDGMSYHRDMANRERAKVRKVVEEVVAWYLLGEAAQRRIAKANNPAEAHQ